MHLLLYTDDTMIMSESYEDIQAVLIALHDYWQKSSLKFNIRHHQNSHFLQ